MFWKFLNIFGFALWLATIPAAIFFGWIYSVAFISVASIYANVISHLSGWRADAPDPEVMEKLAAIEDWLAKISEQLETEGRA